MATVLLHVTDADGTRRTLEWPADRSITKIGRLPSSHVQLRGDGVARIHAVMERAGGELMLIDLGSSAGTRVNGTHRHKSTVADGDVLTFGACAVRVEIPGWEPGRIGAPPAMDRPPRAGRCPRCKQGLSLRRAEPEGYRDVPMRFLRCDRCALTAVESATLEARYGRPDPIGDSLAVRSREPANQMCPACLDGLDRVTLEWDSRWVTVEACPGCGCVVLDDGEGFTLDALLAATK